MSTRARYAHWLGMGISALLLASCGPKVPPPDPYALTSISAERLILDYDRNHCAGTVLYDDHHNGSYMTIPGGMPNETDTMLTWMRAVLNREHFQELKLEHQGNCISSAEFKSPIDNWRVLFQGCIRAPSDGTSARLVGCVAMPSTVSVLDVTPDAANPKRTTVVYTSTLVPTSIGKLLSEPGSANESGVTFMDLQNANHHALDLPQNKEYRATFQRLDATGWRVDDTTFFNPEPSGP